MYYRTIFLYLLFWIVLSENVKIETLCIGIIISLLVTSLNVNLVHSKRQFNFKRNIILWISYTIKLLKEIFVSNFNVAKIVLSPQIIISPQIVIIETKIKSDFHKTIFANSITLTPGTLTISLDRNKIAIHCLKDEFAIGLTNSDFERTILKIEEGMYE
jgi:multicomponent Na+:H+ antiporter subunit E